VLAHRIQQLVFIGIRIHIHDFTFPDAPAESIRVNPGQARGPTDRLLAEERSEMIDAPVLSAAAI
jgi:hypothetical protein